MFCIIAQLFERLALFEKNEVIIETDVKIWVMSDRPEIKIVLTWQILV
jgi:hypothetical protein